jgi:DNA-binding transcriptional LysR family regulator
LELVSAGLGITFVPEIGVRLKRFPSNMTFFSVGEPEFSWKFGIAYRQNHQINDFVRGLMNSIRDYLRMIL